MNKNKKRLPEKLKLWKDAGKTLHLSTLHIQMARELGINPKTLGSLDNHRQEPWKAPLPIFLEELYFKRFRKERPERVVSLEAREKDRDAGSGPEDHDARIARTGLLDREATG